MMKRVAQFVTSVAFGGLALYLAFRQVDLRQSMAVVCSLQPDLLLPGFVLMVVSYLFRGARWRIWAPGLSYWESLRLILIGFMGNNVLPSRLGEVLRAHCAATKLKGNYGRTAALASIAAERILDGLLLAVLALVGMRLVTIESRLRWPLFLVSFAFIILTCTFLLSIRFHKKIRSLIAIANATFPGRVTRFAREKVGYFLDGLLPLGTRSRLMSSIAITAIIWGIEIGSYYLVGLAIWNDMSVRLAILFLVVVNFGSLIPFTIGGIGTIEALSLVFLMNSGVPRNPALAMILVQHSAQYLFTTVVGGSLYLGGSLFRMSPGRRKAPRVLGSTTPSPAIEETLSNLGRRRELIELKPTPPNEIQLSIVIPAYNEQARLVQTVLETINWCTTQDLNFEVIIADDGSQDETLALARLFEESDVRIRALACPHLGKGSAVRLGVLNAKGRYVLFMDADGATPLTEVPKLLASLGEGHDVVIGSRVGQHPDKVQVRTPLHRRIIGRIFAFFVNLFAVEGIADTQCGFKMFRREAALAIFSRQKILGFAFDVEILFIAKRLSLKIAEIPVNWVAQPGSRVNLVIDSIKMLRDISLICWMHRDFEPDFPLDSARKLRGFLDRGFRKSRVV